MNVACLRPRPGAFHDSSWGGLRRERESGGPMSPYPPSTHVEGTLGNWGNSQKREEMLQNVRNDDLFSGGNWSFSFSSLTLCIFSFPKGATKDALQVPRDSCWRGGCITGGDWCPVEASFSESVSVGRQARQEFHVCDLAGAQEDCQSELN